MNFKDPQTTDNAEAKTKKTEIVTKKELELIPLQSVDTRAGKRRQSITMYANST